KYNNSLEVQQVFRSTTSHDNKHKMKKKRHKKKKERNEKENLKKLSDKEYLGFYTHTYVVNDKIESKPKSLWDDDVRKRLRHKLKAKNIITSAISYDEFYKKNEILYDLPMKIKRVNLFLTCKSNLLISWTTSLVWVSN
ncbi:hypothetical protein CR513_01456, partial [Mucuna pruriens]